MNRSELAAQTDLCVKCGLCLPHCPTYNKTQDENESPRGRLSLIQGWARGALEASPELIGHVDRCLLCRACEAACPAYVPYGRIVDEFRQDVGDAGKPLSARLKAGAVRQVLTHAPSARLAGRFSGSKLRKFTELSGMLRPLGFAELTAGLPERSDELPSVGFHPASCGAETGQVDLFLGCTAQMADSETAQSAVRVLNRLGLGVRIPERQTCCGALSRHGGDAKGASGQMARNLSAFSGGNPIVSFASGCAAMLREYRDVMSGAESESFSGRIQDISHFLAKHPWPEDLELPRLEARACIHAPCSLKNMLRSERYVAELLRKVPNLKVTSLPAATRCCGAAGSYMLEHPAMAAALRNDTLDAVLEADPDYLVTSNPGCAMHLRSGLKLRGRKDIEILHPVTLIARLMGDGRVPPK